MTDFRKNEFTSRLRELVAQYGGPKRFCEKTDFNIQTVKKWMNGSSNPTTEFLAKMVALGMPVPWLLSGEDDESWNPNDPYSPTPRFEIDEFVLSEALTMVFTMYARSNKQLSDINMDELAGLVASYYKAIAPREATEIEEDQPKKAGGV